MTPVCLFMLHSGAKGAKVLNSETCTCSVSISHYETEANKLLSSPPAGTHISVMASGRWAGMAVRPLPRQSTMLLLQVHMGGQEPDAKLHG